MTTPRESLIEDHKEGLAYYYKRLVDNWHKRYNKNDRDYVRLMLENARHHKHMIEQLEMLPDMNPVDFFRF